MIIVCAGMFRSGSTWQYQVACELVRHTELPVFPLGFLEGAQLEEFLKQPRNAESYYIYKTHSPDPIHLTLASSETRILYSYRDLRDVAYSMAYKFSIDFWESSERNRAIENCIVADQFWGTLPNAFVQRYEDWVSDNLYFVKKIAAHLEVDISEDVAVAVAENFNITRNRMRTAELAVQLTAEGVDLSDPANTLRYSPESLLHWNHIREGTVGEWRTIATAEERAFLSKLCKDWLVSKGYEQEQPALPSA